MGTTDLRKVKAAARQYTDEAIQTLRDCLKDENGRVRVAAAEALLDRGWGRVAQEPGEMSDINAAMLALQKQKLENEIALQRQSLMEGGGGDAPPLIPGTKAFDDFLEQEWGFARTGVKADQ